MNQAARKTSFATPYRIINGPYRFLKHPLYIGNFFLVIGVTIMFNPPLIYALVITVLFFVMYGSIIVSEHLYLQRLPERTVGFKNKNCTGEISTIIILVVILMIHVFVPKNIL